MKITCNIFNNIAAMLVLQTTCLQLLSKHKQRNGMAEILQDFDPKGFIGAS